MSTDAVTPAQRVEAILREAVGRDLSSWERFEFLPSIKSRNSLSEKQEACLSKIEERLNAR